MNKRMIFAVAAMPLAAISVLIAGVRLRSPASVAGKEAVSAVAPDFDALKKQAEAGNALAQWHLSRSYSLGYYKTPEGSEKVAKNYKEGVKWAKLSAEHGNANAQMDAAEYYFYGKGVDKDKAEAKKWFQRAASQGHTYAQYMLGLLYNDDKDYVSAYKWFVISKICAARFKNWTQETPRAKAAAARSHINDEEAKRAESEAESFVENLVSAR